MNSINESVSSVPTCTPSTCLHGGCKGTHISGACYDIYEGLGKCQALARCSAHNLSCDLESALQRRGQCYPQALRPGLESNMPTLHSYEVSREQDMHAGDGSRDFCPRWKH